MRNISVLILTIFATGCNAENETSECEFGIEIVEDTASNTGEPVEDDMSSGDCEFWVGQGGSNPLGNELEFTYTNTPPSMFTSNSANLLYFTVTSLHKECDPIVVTELPLKISDTNDEGIDGLTVYGIREDGGHYPYPLLIGLTETGLYGWDENYNELYGLVAYTSGALVIPPGESRNFVVMGDPSNVTTDQITIEMIGWAHACGNNSCTTISGSADVVGEPFLLAE